MSLSTDLADGGRSYTKLLQNQAPGTYQSSVYSKETTKKIIPGTTTYSTYQKFGSPTTEPGQSKVYNYSEEYRTDSRNRSLRDLPPSPRSHRSSSPRSPSPHRSPSPVSFAQPPEPKNYSGSSHSSYTTRTLSPQPVQKFSPSDPSRIKWVLHFGMTRTKYYTLRDCNECVCRSEEVTWVAHATPPVTRRFPARLVSVLEVNTLWSFVLCIPVREVHGCVREMWREHVFRKRTYGAPHRVWTLE